MKQEIFKLNYFFNYCHSFTNFYGRAKAKTTLNYPNYLSFVLCACMRAKLLQSCPTLHSAMDHRSPGPSVHGILKARILEWISHELLQGIFLTQGWKLSLLHLLHWQQGSLPLAPPGKPLFYVSAFK